MILKGLEVGAIAANCYVIGCEETMEAAVIDPGGSASAILRLIESLKVAVKYIINTHGHIDHIGANRQLKEATGAMILIHADDAKMLTNPASNFSMFMGRSITSPPPDQLLAHGDIIRVGSTIELEVIHTPGHSPGGICLKTDNIIFSGDTLFAGSIGRTDFPGGSYATLIRSIQERILCYDDNVVVYPGHGPATTVGWERKHNPFL
ncbi:MAG: MBL fold metallo-hydrolase [Syntrophomonadaceae bacterium]|jgi:glyoxylase-like metal-dependent hydrolase (beta-lactamase superfamily II)|nr:MBL fold metallo-hydrolase [Syntrophomonadaceae bacterium]